MRTWHLEGTLGETLCGKSTLPMKAAPGASWECVMNPCQQCNADAELAEAQEIAEAQHKAS